MKQKKLQEILVPIKATLPEEVVKQERHWLTEEMPTEAEKINQLYPSFQSFVSSLAEYLAENKEHLKNLSVYELITCRIPRPEAIIEKWEQLRGEILTPIFIKKGPRKATDVMRYASQEWGVFLGHIISRLDVHTSLELATWEALNLVTWFRRTTKDLLKFAEAEADADRYSNQSLYAIEEAVQTERDLEYLGYNLLEQIEEMMLNEGWNSQEVAEWETSIGKPNTPEAIRQRHKRRREALENLRKLQDFGARE